MKINRIDLAFAAGLMVVIALVVFKVYMPQMDRIKQSTAEAGQLTETLRTSDQVTMDVQQIEGEIGRIGARLKAFDTQLPPATEIDKFLSQISEIAARSDVKLDLIQPGDIGVRSLYAELPITIEGTCRFPQFYAMLREIRNMPRLTKVADLQFAANMRDPMCKVQMTLLIFLCRRGV